MIAYDVLKQLVLEVFRTNPPSQYGGVGRGVNELVAAHGLFPTQEECRMQGIDFRYYQRGTLNPRDEVNINQIVWDLIIDRVLTIGADSNNGEWPFLRLTEFGQTVVQSQTPSFYDPEGYLNNLDSFAPGLDAGIRQYILEGIRSFRQRLYFASAVMLGAAAEKMILLLLDAMKDAEPDGRQKAGMQNLLERPNLPSIFKTIQDKLDVLTKAKKIPYKMHEGSTQHLLSLFEMIRVQRNDAVHPATGQVSKEKIFLTIQSLPGALETIYRLINWFKEAKV